MLQGNGLFFNRGRFALEGNSGLRQMKEFLSYLKNHEVIFSAWVINQAILNNMEAGLTLWPGVKSKLIPLSTYHLNDVMWNA